MGVTFNFNGIVWLHSKTLKRHKCDTKDLFYVRMLPVEIKDEARTAIISKAASARISKLALVLEPECKDFCCGPPMLDVRVTAPAMISNDSFVEVASHDDMQIFFPKDMLEQVAADDELIINVVGDEKKLSGMLVPR